MTGGWVSTRYVASLHTAAEVTDDFENSRSASLNFLFRLSALLFVFLQQTVIVIVDVNSYNGNNTYTSQLRCA